MSLDKETTVMAGSQIKNFISPLQSAAGHGRQQPRIDAGFVFQVRGLGVGVHVWEHCALSVRFDRMTGQPAWPQSWYYVWYGAGRASP